MPTPEHSGAPDHHVRRSAESDPVSASLAQLERSVAAIQDSETFRAYLTAQARFHEYSWGNVLLILGQRPDSTRVAGYRTWQSLGRQVRKGEKAIRIIAPAYARKQDTDEQADEGRARQVAFFRSASVFDVSQTEGDPLPEVAVPILDSQAGADLYVKLEGVALAEGLRVTIGHETFLRRPQLMGFYEPDARAIYVKEAAQLQQTKTLAHELGHHFANHQASGPASETEAEAVAYVVLAHFGLDSGTRSFPYIATWSQEKTVLKAALATIQTVSATIMQRVGGPGVVHAAERCPEPPAC